MPDPLPNLASSHSWREQLRDAVSDPAELLRALGLQPQDVGYSAAAAQQFALKAPHSFIRRMRRGDPADPLLRQVLAGAQETLPQPGYVDDPVEETGAANRRPGLIHKYHGRVLLIVSGGCAVHCRYCFRRHFPYADNQVGRAQWRDALAAVREDDSIAEVILSGGDPLVATDAQLAALVAEIAAIPHVRRLRVHTRLPVVIPDRVTAGLLHAIGAPRLRTVVVLHSNHANEIDGAVRAAVTALRGAGIEVLNQAVLLAGVNDTVATQVALNERLFDSGITPYYLHLLDPVRGAAHFDVPRDKALALQRAVRARLPGYLVPALVREEPGADAKVVLG